MNGENNIISKILKGWSIFVGVIGVVIFLAVLSQLYEKSYAFLWFLIIAFAAGSQIVLCMCLARILDKTYENGKKIDSLFKGDLDEN